ncbi:hypothetical protein, partial [Corynebacterium otitidis]
MTTARPDDADRPTGAWERYRHLWLVALLFASSAALTDGGAIIRALRDPSGAVPAVECVLVGIHAGIAAAIAGHTLARARGWERPPLAAAGAG